MRIRNDEGVSPVIAVVLMVSITVVLAAVAWLMVSGMITKLDVPPTYIGLTKEGTQTDPTERIIHVAGVEKTFNLANFEVALIINYSIDNNSRMNPLINGTAGNLTFLDMNGDGRLNVGDDFTVSIVPNTTYELKIFWKKNGAQITTTNTWTE